MIRALFAVLGDDFAAPLRRMLAWLVAAAALQGVGFGLLVPVLRELLGPAPAGALPWLGLLAVVFLGHAVARGVGQLAGFDAGSTLSAGLHRRIGNRLTQLPLGWFTPGRIGEVSTLATVGVTDVMKIPAHMLPPLVNAVVTPVVVVALMFLFDWRIGLTLLLCVPLLVLAYRWTAGLMQRSDATRHDAIDEAANRVVEFATQQPVIRAFGRGENSLVLLDDALLAERDASRRLLRAGSLGVVGFACAVQVAFSVVLVIGAVLAVGGSIEVPELLALLVLTVRFIEPITGLADVGGSIRVAHNFLTRMQAMLDTPALPEPDVAVTPGEPVIEFDHVTFGYSDDPDVPPALRDISLTVPRHSMLALVGPSGSGKTTISRLIARYFDVDAGAVRLGGTDVRELGAAAVMSQVSMVFQDVYLFEGTIEENIRLGRPDAQQAQVREAARLAGVDEIARRLPGGWSTQVGEGGAGLSGGERQRVSIARAILKDAPIVLLDEATSALDPETEAAVQRGLAALRADRTVVVIAHRLQTIVSADRIAFVEDGRIVEEGDHTGLLAQGGRYAAFWARRRSARGWRLDNSATPNPAPG